MLAHDDRGAGRPLVLVHGLGSDRRRWTPVADRLVDRFRCVSVDLPGHGRSPDEGCEALSAAAALGELATALGLDAPVVVGHSLGATVALLCGAASRPAGVVAVDPTPLNLPDVAAGLAPYRDRLLGDDFDAAFAEWEHERFLSGSLSPREAAALGEGIRPRQEVVLSYWRNVLDVGTATAVDVHFRAALAAVAVPTLVCLGRPPTPQDAAVLAAMPTTTVEVSEGLGHFLHLRDPDAFAQRLARWVDALPPG